MIVLGIHDGHDASICLLRDGKLLVVSPEERRRNHKSYPGVPEHSLATAFKRLSIDPKDVDMVALTSRIRTTVPTRQHKPIYTVLNYLSFLGRTQWGTRTGQWLLERLSKRQDLLNCLTQLGLGNKPVVRFDHHLCHAATAYYHRPWSDDALILTMDGAGDGLCATVSVGKGLDIRPIAKTPKYHSPAAYMYSAITAYLGMRPYEHEYKIMGMAPYGDADYCIDVFRKAFAVDGLEFRNRTNQVAGNMPRWYSRKLFGQRFDNISAACQQVFEELVLTWTKNAVQATGIRKIATAGGAFLNVKANKLIRELPEVDALYTYPASDDGGTPVGAAVLGYLQLCKERGTTPSLDLPKEMYLGFEFTPEEMQRAAETSGLPFRRMANAAADAAALLAAGKILGRFAGKEEIGPRALGNRSILADPRDLRVIRKLNFAIKQRDFWMPFAGSVLEEDAPRYIKNLSGWPYWMIEAFDTTPEGADRMAAAIHPYDQTIRPQVVNELNPSYRDLLRAFKGLTGVGGVLNTSFNLHGYPIVGTPEVALDTLKKSELDAVVLGDFLVEKKPAS